MKEVQWKCGIIKSCSIERYKSMVLYTYLTTSHISSFVVALHSGKPSILSVGYFLHFHHQNRWIRICVFKCINMHIRPLCHTHTGCMHWPCVRTLFPCISIANDSSLFRLKYAYAFGICNAGTAISFSF